MNGKIERIITVLGFVLAGWMLWLFMFSTEHSLPDDRIDAEAEASRSYPKMVVRTTASERLSEQRIEEDIEEASKPLPKGAKAGERVYRFGSKEALAAYLAEAKRRGIPVLGVLDAFNAVRVGASNYVPEGATGFYNYAVSMPVLPDDRNLNVNGGGNFEGNALAYLGVDEVDPTWGSGVQIAVLDTGVSEHPSLEGVQVEVKDVANVTLGDGVDDNGHGTAAISIIAGNDDYVQGLAPGAEILSYKILDANGEGDTFSLSAAIWDAINSGADIVSVSAGSLTDDPLLAEAVLYAWEKGVPIVVAGGNDGESLPRYPAAYDTVIGVGSVDKNGLRSAFSNTGSISIMAPSDAYSGWIDGEHVLFYGTSASTLFVTATIADVMSQQPGISAKDAAALVLANANEAGPAGDDAYFGQGILDSGRTFRSDEPGYVDAGISTPFVMSAANGEGNAEVVFSIENRGTVFLSNAHIDIEMNGQKYTYPTQGLQIGESKSVSLSIPMDTITESDPTKIKVSTRLSDFYEDMNTSNNEISIQLTPKANP